MQTIRWYRLFALGALAVPVGARAQEQGPQPKITEIATIPGVAAEYSLLMPNGHVILFGEHDSVCTYDTRTKAIRKIVSDWEDELVLSPRADRIAFGHAGDNGDQYIWTMAIDPATGAPTGAAQRVSLSAGDSPSFSPDGKTIAFGIWRSSGDEDLATLPATGGPERIVAKAIHATSETLWSADGQSLFTFARGGKDSASTLVRTPIAGGQAKVVASFTTPAPAEGAIDGQVAFYRADNTAIVEGRLAYVTTSGTHGEVHLPPDASSSLSLRSPRTSYTSVHRTASIHLLDIGTGTVRTITAPPIVPGSIRWSLDGKRFAALLADPSLRSHGGVIVMNADGSGQHQFNVAATGGLQLSPHGDLLSLGTANGGKVAVLDVATGKVRNLAGPEMSLMGMHWRSDGKAIFVEAMLPIAGSAKPHLSIVSIDLAGSFTVLRDVTAEFPKASRADPYNDATAAVFGPQMSPTFIILPMAGGAAHPASVPPLGGARATRPFDSRDGKWLVQRVTTAAGVTSLVLYDANGQFVRSVEVPLLEVQGSSLAFPDGEHALVAAKGASDSTLRYYVVPLDGGAPKAIATGQAATGNFALSPDGKSLIFVSVKLVDSRIALVDFSPLLQSILKH